MEGWQDFRNQALFGLVDGLNGAVGLVIGLLRSHVAAQIVLVALLSRAGSSAVSMAGAQYESDSTDSSRRVRMGRVGAMGSGYLISALLPGLGFVVDVQVGLIVFIPLVIATLAVITWFRAGSVGWLRASATTLLIFVLAVVVGFLAGSVG